MGHEWIQTCTAPTEVPAGAALERDQLHPLALLVHAVAVQVAFERQILKPVFRLIGYRVWV
jgi:hypothetical protein